VTVKKGMVTMKALLAALIVAAVLVAGCRTTVISTTTSETRVKASTPVVGTDQEIKSK
jgi:hypothetical protein